ncbi:serine/threonine-protein kinase [Streptomyces sp. 110]|uniref:Serine/threonine-protein kinase n=1 Tax=Streptomyces endocoffeicus TaxID=2898945 RepID=A0ABS1Q6Q1_9ACTN|nr:PQQ-binding-like beta-propeller repeat protein [Streptomyces endocoffeicus]MBL1119842.1 serine/threonine-protein kinase [Streptomyces endocoffeicus]
MTTQGDTTATHIGPYRVIRELGAGGMGRVHLAASRSGRAVAVKVIRPELAADPDFRRRFKAEVDAARAVGGAFTAPVVDADPEGPRPWLATAYIPGPSLTDAIAAHGPMPEATLRVLGAGLAEALAAIHRAGLIHRDLKPSNILLTADGPRVIDFGISRVVDGTVLTAEGQIIGSPGFMSPEQSTGAELTSASDVFALGAVLAFAATGALPFGTGTPHALLYRATHGEPELAGVPQALLGIVAACLDKDPARRPTVTQLQGCLRPATTAGWLGAVQSQVTAARRSLHDEVRTPLLSRRRLLAGAVLGVAAAATGTALILRSRDGDTTAIPELSWTADLPQPGMSLLVMTPSTLLCGGETSGVCLDRATGKLLWKDLGGQNTGTTADNKRVYTVRTDGKVHAVDGRSGKEQWAASPAEAGAPELELANGSLLVTRSDGRLQGIDASSGEVRWQTPDMGGPMVVGTTRAGHLIVWGRASKSSTTAILNGYTVIASDTGDRLWSKDLVALYPPSESEVLYAIDGDMRLLALKPADGETLWSEPTSLPPTNNVILGWQGSLNLLQGTLFCYPGAGAVGATGGLLTAFDPKTGKTLWSVRTAARGNRGYDRSGDTVCYLDKVLHAVDARTGARRWTAGSGLGELQFLGAIRGLFLLAGKKGLYGFDAETGQQIWHHPVSGGSGSWSAFPTDDQVFASWSGKLFCFSVSRRHSASPTASRSSTPYSVSRSRNERG